MMKIGRHPMLHFFLRIFYTKQRELFFPRVWNEMKRNDKRKIMSAKKDWLKRIELRIFKTTQ